MNDKTLIVKIATANSTTVELIIKQYQRQGWRVSHIEYVEDGVLIHFVRSEEPHTTLYFAAFG